MYKENITQAHQQIESYIHNTPVLTSTSLDKMTGANLFFKCENFQKIGAFKMRGATNAILQLTDEQRNKGVVTHSSGNFAQALSLAAKSLGVKAFIVMPSTAPQVKKDAVSGYGGIIIECEPTLLARKATAKRVQQKEGATYIHSSNDIDVINGHATACKELLENQPDLDCVFVPVGGGALISGTALSAHCFGKNCKVIGGEPFEADDAYRSLESGKIESNINANTIADGLKTELGDVTFPIIQKHVDRIIRVTEQEIVLAMQLIWERMKLVVEPSSAVALAALLKEKAAFQHKKIGIIISGGNVDLSKLPF